MTRPATFLIGAWTGFWLAQLVGAFQHGRRIEIAACVAMLAIGSALLFRYPHRHGPDAEAGVEGEVQAEASGHGESM